MLHRIEIENYRSIRETQVIDLRLPRTTPDMPRFVASHGDEGVRLPTVVAFFGPNASGKTTILRALTSTLDFAVHSFSTPPDQPIPYFWPFRSANWWDRPTRIIVDFDAEWIDGVGRVYRYELAIGHSIVDGATVLTEALLVRNGRRFRALFRRDKRGIRCATELSLPSYDSRLKAVRPNASLISTMAQLNHPIFREAWDDIALTQRNLFGLQTAPFNIESALRFLHSDQQALADLKSQLRRLDLGLQDITIENTPHGLVAAFQHEGLTGMVLQGEESNGTRRFLAMFPVLWFTLQTGRPAIIDEFDVDLHPLLVPELLNWFHDPVVNPYKAQLFFAGHNAALMEYLEKEEIFLVEKSRGGASTVTALRDFQGLRREPSLQKKYLGGAFGAVPNIG